MYNTRDSVVYSKFLISKTVSDYIYKINLLYDKISFKLFLHNWHNLLHAPKQVNSTAIW